MPSARAKSRAKSTAGKAATPRSTRSLNLVLGPVSAAIGFKPLTRDEKIHQKTLCPCHSLPIKQAATCQESGEIVEPIKRYEVGNTYVELDASAFEAESDYTIHLEQAPTDVDPAFYEQPYLIWPQAGHEAQFDMIAAALRKTGRTVIGKSSAIGKATRVVAIRWSDHFGCLVCQLVTYDENVCAADVALVADAIADRPEPRKDYVEMIAKLIEATLPDEFDPAAYTNDYRDRVREALAAAADGQPIPVPAPVAESAPVVDLMAALEQSLAEATKPKGRVTAPKKPAAKKPAARKKRAA